jgi:hypothetical protein
MGDLSRTIYDQLHQQGNQLEAHLSNSRFSNPKTVCQFVAAFFCLVIFLCAAQIQSQVAGSGNIQGTVTDATGALLPNATVILTDTATQQARTTSTTAAGEFQFPNIEISTYKLKVTAAGFESYEQTNIVLEVGSNIAINPKLAVGKADVTVETHADALALQTEDTRSNRPSTQRTWVKCRSMAVRCRP